ncbi:MAG: hypothetical protein V4474_03130 [Patescibacteria group bacterium]
MSHFTVRFAFDVTGVATPRFNGETGPIKIGISPGRTGVKKPDGSVEFRLDHGRIFTAAKAPDNLDNHIAV